MDKGESKPRSKISDALRSAGKSEGTTVENRDSYIWIRKDGAVCVGDECIVIKREPDTKNLDIEIAPSRCGEATADMLMEHIIESVAKGGNTRFTVKSELQDELSGREESQP